jgi:hypothetical protein
MPPEITITKNLEFHDGIKYIEVRHHLPCQLFESGAIFLQYVPTSEQVVTKELVGEKHEHFAIIMGVIKPPSF